MLKKYEGMFLFDPVAMPEWEQIQGELGRLMNRIGARVIAVGRWDERRLAYEIRGRKRGVYALTYFEADGSKIADLERDAALSEAVLRCLIVRAEHMTEEEMKEAAARRAPEPAPEGPGGDRDGDHEGRRSGHGGDRHRRGRQTAAVSDERGSEPVAVDVDPDDLGAAGDAVISPTEGLDTED